MQAASLLHSNGDAMDIAVREGRIVGVRGRAADRVNRGRLGPKDLYDLHPPAARNSLHWEMLAQVARATRDEQLLTLVGDCHPQTLRQLRWTHTMVKILAPQLLSGV
ncbi:hypothetical protein [Streptomyces tibetensis]|uniref:hypothetical protein n=1 Tax=Streptomyces tibetensis TaxID=2382123 RepID=UPI003F53F930